MRAAANPQARVALHLPDGLPPLECTTHARKVEALAELARVYSIGPDVEALKRLAAYNRSKKVIHMPDPLERTSHRLHSAAQAFREYRRSGSKAKPPGLVFFPVNEWSEHAETMLPRSSLATDLIELNLLAETLGAEPADDVLQGLLLAMSRYSHVSPGTEARLSRQGYTVGELLIDMACGVFIERAGRVLARAALIGADDLERDARRALRSVVVSRAIELRLESSRPAQVPI